MNRYNIPLIAIPKSLQKQLTQSGSWQNFYESCSRRGTEIWLFNSRIRPDGLRQLKGTLPRNHSDRVKVA